VEDDRPIFVPYYLLPGNVGIVLQEDATFSQSFLLQANRGWTRLRGRQGSNGWEPYFWEHREIGTSIKNAELGTV
jgi:hypothetical protein